MIEVFSPETISALICSFAVSFAVLLTQRWHGRLTGDHDLQSIQKLHKKPVPRVGGLGVVAGLGIATLMAFMMGDKNYSLMATLLLCAAPAFLAGFGEDLTKRVSVRMRLNASFASAALAIWMMDAELTRLNTPVLDTLVTFVPLSVLFTCFAVGGMTHAINIIDGLNGLAAGCVALMMAGLAAIAWQVGDTQVMTMCLWGIAALVGFLCLNFPFGRIFLGDGGAYLAGFWLAECGVLLLKRNPEVSTWAVLLCCIYPAWETLYSVYRRQILQRVNSGQPDMTHMHHLVYKRIATYQGGAQASSTWATHGTSSILIWSGIALCPIVASLAYSASAFLSGAVLVFIAAYNWTYRYMLRAPSSGDALINPGLPPPEGNQAPMLETDLR